MYGQSHMETYIPICKIDSRWQFTVYLRKLKQGALYQPSGVGWVGRWEGSSKRRGYMYTYGWFMLTFDRKRQNSVKQLSFSSVQLLSRVRLFATPWTAARQASLSITNSWSPPKPMSTESVMPSNHVILCHPLLLLPSIFPIIRVFSNESVLHIMWPKYWSFSLNISSSNQQPGLVSFRMDWLDLLAVQGTFKSLLQHHSSKASILRHSAFFTVQLSYPYMTTGKPWVLKIPNKYK